MRGARIDNPLRRRRCQMNHILRNLRDGRQRLRLVQIAEHRRHAQGAQRGTLRRVARECVDAVARQRQRNQPQADIATTDNQ